MFRGSTLCSKKKNVDGTEQTSLGQFSGRVQQTYKHSVTRFFVPENGTMFTLALVRLPPTATKEIQYLNAKGALTYTDIAGDPVLYGNLPPRFFFLSRRRHTRCSRDWSSDVCSSDLTGPRGASPISSRARRGGRRGRSSPHPRRDQRHDLVRGPVSGIDHEVEDPRVTQIDSVDRFVDRKSVV